MKPGLAAAEIASRGEAPFLVVVHDVCPVFQHEVTAIIDALNPSIGRKMAAAVVPKWHGQAIDDGRFCESLADHFDEILLHGRTHQRERGGGVISFVTQHSDEFAGLNADDALQRLKLGQEQLTKLFGHRIAGFVPPAWQRGPIRGEILQQSGLDYLMGYRAIQWADGHSIPLSTLTWDVGRFTSLGVAAEWVGRLLYRYSPQRMACLAIHPVDVSRGYLPRIVRFVERWMTAGGIPVVPGNLYRPLAKETAA